MVVGAVAVAECCLARVCCFVCVLCWRWWHVAGVVPAAACGGAVGGGRGFSALFCSLYVL